MKRVLLLCLLLSTPAMAQRTINSLPAGTPAQATDEIAIQRGTVGTFSYKLTVADIRAAIALSAITGLGSNVSTWLATPSSANLASAVTDETGTGSLVFSNSPTLVTPALGTPSALVGTNITGTAAGLTAGTASAVAVGGITGLGTGVGTWLATPSSANLASAVTGETGSGALVFGTSPSLTTPTLGVATATSLNGLTVTTSTGTLTVPNGVTMTGPASSGTTATLGNAETFATGTKTVTAKFDFGGGTLEIPNSNTLPGTCAVGDSYMDTDATSGARFYLCESANTWAVQGGGGSGSPGGANTQVQFNNSGSFGGSADLTWDGTTLAVNGDVTANNLVESGALTDGLPCVYESTGTLINCDAALTVAQGGTGLTSGTSGGVLAFTASGTLASSGVLTDNRIVLGAGAGAAPNDAAGLATDGTSQLQLGVAGTSVGSVRLANATSGTITIQPAAGALGTVTLTVPATSGTILQSGTAVTVAQGGTGIASGTSGGVPYFSGSTSIASSAALAANALVLGGGAGAAPATTTTGTGVVTALGVNTGSAGAFGVIIAKGTSAMGTSAISSGTCASVVTTSATGVATTDVINWGFNTDPTAITGWGPSTSGGLFAYVYPTANNVNTKICNNTSGSITPTAMTINWIVIR